MEAWVFSPKYHPKNQPDISFSVVWQYWLGIAKPKNVFRSTPTSSYGILKFSHLTEFSIN